MDLPSSFQRDRQTFATLSDSNDIWKNLSKYHYNVTLTVFKLTFYFLTYWIFSPHSFKRKKMCLDKVFFSVMISLPSQALQLILTLIGSRFENELKRLRLKDCFMNWGGLEYKCAGENAAESSWLRDLGGRDKGTEYILLSRQQAQVLCVRACAFVCVLVFISTTKEELPRELAQRVCSVQNLQLRGKLHKH